MELTRNHYLIIGLVVLFLGIELRYVKTAILNEPTTKLVNEYLGPPQAQPTPVGIFPAMGPVTRRQITPPPWLGWALMSTGGVIVLQSLVMTKPAA